LKISCPHYVSLDKRDDLTYAQDIPAKARPGSAKGQLNKFAQGQESFSPNGEKERKAHNKQIEEAITKLQKEREQLGVEHYSKSRAVATPRSFRDEQMLEEYLLRIQEIDKRVAEINAEIKRLRSQKLK
jgi:hypothetical protein